MSEIQDSIYCKGCGKELPSGIEFCPSCGKEKSMAVRYKKHTGSTMGSGQIGLVFFGGLLIISGFMPSFLIDTSIAGVTSTTRLWSNMGIASVVIGIAMILFGATGPRVRMTTGR